MSHHDLCVFKTGAEPEQTDTCLVISVGHRSDGSLITVVRFASGERLTADADSPDLGFSEPDTCLHDVAHTLLAARLGLDRSPVLERVVNLRPLSQRNVDLEEAATFAIQAFCAGIRGDDPGPAIQNALASLQSAASGGPTVHI